VASWDEALDHIASALQDTDPARVAFYLTSRGITNEVYYAAQKAARFIGTNHVDNSARLCHAASTAAMKATLGYGASTCSYTDWLQADLIVFLGSNVANNQPVTTKYLHYAKENGAKIAVVNTFREPGLDRYWVPSVVSSAVLGTFLGDHWFHVHTGGDLAFLIGVLRALIESGGVDNDFVAARTVGFDAARDAALASDWEALERESGESRERMQTFAQLLIEHPKTIFVWSMGLTQHAHGVETIKALVNVGLARGLPGRDGSASSRFAAIPACRAGGGGMRPQSGCGHRIALGGRLGIPDPVDAWLDRAEMVEHAADGDVDVFWMVGGNFPRDAARCLPLYSRPRAPSSSRPPGHRRLVVDAR
jgi:anaerobic selenocysteine-containing dehydrogenase